MRPCASPKRLTQMGLGERDKMRKLPAYSSRKGLWAFVASPPDAELRDSVERRTIRPGRATRHKPADPFPAEENEKDGKEDRLQADREPASQCFKVGEEPHRGFIGNALGSLAAPKLAKEPREIGVRQRRGRIHRTMRLHIGNDPSRSLEIDLGPSMAKGIGQKQRRTAPPRKLRDRIAR